MQIMTRIGAVCLITIGIWCVIELAVQFGHVSQHGLHAVRFDFKSASGLEDCVRFPVLPCLLW